MEEINSEKQNAIQQLRSKVEHCLPTHMNTDDELAKWLIARNYNLEKAENMLLQHLKWREEWDIDNILNWQPPEVLTKYYGVGFCGYDKDGCPVWIVPCEDFDLKGLVQSCTPEDYIRYTLQNVERSIKNMKFKSKDGKLVTTHTCIFDLQDFPMRHFAYKPAMDVILQLAQIYEANYPETLKFAFFVNTPRLFTLIMAMIKPFLDEITISKIKLFGHNGWKEAILEAIPKDQLPCHWGGTMRDPDDDPKCPSKICLGGEVPKRYYLKNLKQSKSVEKNDNNSFGDFNLIILPQGGKESIQINILKSGNKLSWMFHSEDFDVGFAISRKLSNGDEEFIVPLNRVNSQSDIQEGSVICEHCGTYKIIFDNSYSYLRSKKVYYKVEQISSSEQTKL